MVNEGKSVEFRLYRDGEPDFPNGHLLLCIRTEAKNFTHDWAMMAIYFDSKRDVIEGLGFKTKD